jgi:hypothetical protein
LVGIPCFTIVSISLVQALCACTPFVSLCDMFSLSITFLVV